MHFLIFVFLFNQPYICFGRDPAIIRVTLISSLYYSLVETCVRLIEKKYENKKLHSLVQKLKINVKMHGEHNMKHSI
jgi:hypothetical protein